MTDNVLSESWYRVAELKPRVRAHVNISAHRYRGEIWYVIRDAAAARYHRFTPSAYFLINQMNGARSMDEIWNAAEAEFGDDAPTQDEVLHLLGDLYASDVLQCDVSPDSLEVLTRHQQQLTAKRKQRFANPLALRIPLFDPDRLLERITPWFGFVFSRITLVIWLIVVVSALVLCFVNWPALTHNVADRVFSANNLLAMLVVFPIIKLFHEFGHAIATKHWGGEVHEMGISLLVLAPVPYVDASASSAFAHKRKRIVVAAAGMMVELFLAALALHVWLNIEAGLVSAILFNVMVIAGVSTIVFNGNPLLRFDAYYILVDVLEIPNLGTRAPQYLGYLLQRYVFKLKSAHSPVCAQGEATWFVLYGVAAFFYRIALVVLIATLVATKFFIVGVALAAFAIIKQLIMPAARQLWFLLVHPNFIGRRGQAIGITASALAAFTVCVFYLPVPLWTYAEGVVWLPEQAQLRAASDGIIEEILVPNGTHIERDTPLATLSDPFITTELTILDARLAEIDARFNAVVRQDRVEAEVINNQRDAVVAERTRVAEQAKNLTVLSPCAGRLIIADAENLPGRFVHKGDLIGYVVAAEAASVRAIVTQADIVLIRNETRRVELKPSSDLSLTLDAAVRREVPAADQQLPSKALGSAGGGDIAVDPADARGLRALAEVFQFELTVLNPHAPMFLGERVHVRFDHGAMPLGRQWYWRTRQLFLRHFRV